MQPRSFFSLSRQLVGRAIRLRCPRCGLRYDPRGESLAFMYVSTAFLTGVMLIVMLLMHPETVASGRMIVIPAALLLYLSTLPVRKALAIALNYINGPPP